MMKCNSVSSFLSSAFYKIGYNIGLHPQIHLATMITIIAVLGIGMHKISLSVDVEHLYTPVNSRSKMERKTIEEMFPERTLTGEDVPKRSSIGKVGSIMILPKNNVSILDEDVLNDILRLDDIVRNISLFSNNTFIGYKELFSNRFDKYARNMILFLKRNAARIKKGRVSIKYPIDRRKHKFIAYGINFGGVRVNKTNYLEDLFAFRLTYLLEYGTKQKDELASKWEEKFQETMSEVQLKNIEFYIFTSHLLRKEVADATFSFPVICVFVVLTLSFVVISCVSSDIVTSKPLVGLAGYISPILATASGFGLLLWCNIEFVHINICAVFMVLGVGVDDCFVLLAAWRKTSRKDSVEKRMAETYSNVAISITITSLTNFLSISIGLTTPYRIIQIFSLYSSVSILFSYIYQIFFFGGLLALEGYREKYNLHSFLLSPVKRNSLANEISEEINNNRKDSGVKKEFFRNVFGALLGKWYIKGSAIFVFLVYLACSLYLITRIQQGLNWLLVFPSSSNSFKYLSIQYKYFSDYPHAIQLVFNETLDYSNQTLRKDIDKIIYDLQSSAFMSNETFCWFRAYEYFYKKPAVKYLFENYNMNNSADYLDGLKKIFFRLFPTIKNDVLFNDKGDQIVASRCFILSKDVRVSADEKFLIENLREIADSAKYSVFVHNFYFTIYEQYLNMPIFAIRNIGTAAVVIILIFIIFIPDLISTCLAALTIVCIQVSTIGFMAFWNITLDLVSIIILTMSTGFCIDFSAHVIFFYKKCQEEEPNDKIKATLGQLGYPIIQGYLSTIIGVSVLNFGPSYMYSVFFKIVFLVMLFALFHGLVLMPIVLSIIDNLRFRSKKQKNSICI